MASTALPLNAPSRSSKIKRPPLVLIHGFRGAPSGLEGIAKPLREAGFEVFVPPIPPFAGAQPLPEYNAHNYADYLANYIRRERIDHPILIGHSLGSVVAAATAEYYPTLLDQKLILLSPISTNAPRFFAAISPLSGYLPRTAIDHITTRYLTNAKNHEAYQQTIAATSACSSDHPPRRHDAAAVAKFSGHHSLREFHPYKNILLIAGESDHLIKKSATEELAKRWHAQTTFLPETGHLHNYEQPLETARAILDFLV